MVELKTNIDLATVTPPSLPGELELRSTYIRIVETVADGLHWKEKFSETGVLIPRYSKELQHFVKKYGLNEELITEGDLNRLWSLTVQQIESAHSLFGKP